MEKRKRRQFTHEFKEQIVLLYRNGKSKADILREYDLYPTTLDTWIKQYEATKTFHEADHRTPEQQRLLLLEKENAQLKMENDLLKQAALILGRK